MRPRFLGTRQHSRIVGGSGSTQRYRAAKSRARGLGKTVLRIDLASVINKYTGQTERNIRRLLDEAERANAVLYFDEADNLFEASPAPDAKRASAARKYLVNAARRRRLSVVTGTQSRPRLAVPADPSSTSDDA